ncbi:unnamed protein product [Choristocarpus tenellus]
MYRTLADLTRARVSCAYCSGPSTFANSPSVPTAGHGIIAFNWVASVLSVSLCERFGLFPRGRPWKRRKGSTFSSPDIVKRSENILLRNSLPSPLLSLVTPTPSRQSFALACLRGRIPTAWPVSSAVRDIPSARPFYLLNPSDMSDSVTSLGSVSVSNDTTSGPPVATDEIVLNRDDFTKEEKVVALKVPMKRTSEIMKRLRRELLNMPKRKSVETCPEDPSTRLVLLNTSVNDPDTLDGLSSEALSFVRGEGVEATTFGLTVDYSHLSADQVLKQLLEPVVNAKDLVTSFETVGHLAHLNLREKLLPYRHIIAEVDQAWWWWWWWWCPFYPRAVDTRFFGYSIFQSLGSLLFFLGG